MPAMQSAQTYKYYGLYYCILITLDISIDVDLINYCTHNVNTNFYKVNEPNGTCTHDISFVRRLLSQLRYRSDLIELAHHSRCREATNLIEPDNPEF